MEDKLYPIAENPKYNTQIRALKDSDPARASGVFNPLFEQLIENTHAVKLKGDENEKRIEEVAEESKQTREASHVKLSDGTTVEDALQGKADLDNNGKVSESQLPKMNYDAKGSANAALIDAKAYTDTSAARTLTTAKAYADTLTPTFIYKCTGKADSTTIATIVNNFFDKGTAMSMKLIITGTMGVAITYTYYAIYIDALNTRGARVFLDFSDCYIPEIITENRDFLNLNSDKVNLDIFGLVVATMRCGVLCARALSVTFTNCSIKGGRHTRHQGQREFSGCYNGF